jgi:hypothetical protein
LATNKKTIEMLTSLVTLPEPVELTTLKSKAGCTKIQRALKLIDIARVLYLAAPDQPTKDAMLLEFQKPEGYFKTALQQLVHALVSDNIDPVPACLAPIDTAFLGPMLAAWSEVSTQVKEERDAKELKASQERSGDPLAVAQERMKQVDADFAKLKDQREAIVEFRSFTTEATSAKTQFLVSNVILVDFTMQLHDLLHPSSGMVDQSRITAAVHAMCADIVAATDPNAGFLAGCLKSHSCTKKFNSLRAVRMRMDLPPQHARQTLTPLVKEGAQLHDALMAIVPVSYRLPHSLRSVQRPDTPKREREEPKRSASQEKSAKEKK